jgi:hypothetical protein
MSNILKTCPNTNPAGVLPCEAHGKRYYDTTNFCALCGTKMVEIVQCCEHEGIADTGFCTRCGKAKAERPELKA